MKRKTFLGVILGAMAALFTRSPEKAITGCRVWTHHRTHDGRECHSFLRIDGELIAYEKFDLNTGWQHNAAKRNGVWSITSTRLS